MEKKKEITEDKESLQTIKSLMDYLSSIPPFWLVVVVVIILLSMFEVTQTTGSDAEGKTTNLIMNFHLTSTTVALVALIWLPSLVRLISLLGGGVKTSVGEASTPGLLDHFSTAIDSSIKKLPEVDKQVPVDDHT